MHDDDAQFFTELERLAEAAHSGDLQPHDMSHRLLSPACFLSPGGPKRHVKVWWYVVGRDAIKGGYHRWAHCPYARHEWAAFWQAGGDESVQACAWCGTTIAAAFHVEPDEDVTPEPW